MKQLNQESTTSPLETVLEILMYPLLLLPAGVVIREMFTPPMGKPITLLGMTYFPPTPEPIAKVADVCPTGGPVWSLWGPIMFMTLLATLGVFLYVRLGNFREKDRPFSFVMSLFIFETCLFTPLIIVFRSFESFRLPQQTMLQIMVGFLILLWAVAAMLRGGIRLKWYPLYISIALMTAISAISFAWSPSFVISLKDFAEYGSLLALLLLILNEWDAKKHAPLLAWAAIVVAFVESGLGLMQHFGLNAWLGLGDNIDPFATLGNKNYNAELLAMVFPFGLAWLLRDRRIGVRAFIGATLTMSLFVILLTQTRGAWIGLALSCFVFYLFYLDTANRKTAIALTGILGGLVGAGILLMVLSHYGVMFRKSPLAYSERFFSIFRIVQNAMGKGSFMWALPIGGSLVGLIAFRLILRRRVTQVVATAILLLGIWAPILTPVPAHKATTQRMVSEDGTVTQILDDSITSRSFIWGGTLTMIRHYPMGVGIGAFKVRYLAALKDYIEAKHLKEIPGFFKDVNAKEAHNEYLHILSEMGPIGLLFLLFFIYQLVSLFLSHYYKCRDDGLRLQILGSFCGLVSIGGSAMFGFPFRIVPSATLVVCLLALFLFGNEIVDEESERERLLAEARAKADDEAGRTDDDAERAEGGKKKKKKKTAAPIVVELPETGVRRIGVSPAAGIVSIAAALVFFFVFSNWSYSVQEANIVMKRANGFAQMNEMDIAGYCYKESGRLDPYNGDIHLFSGMYYQRQRMWDQAVKSFETARKYFDLPQIYLNLGAIYFEKGPDYYESAVKDFQESLGVFPNYPLPQYNIGLIHQAWGNAKIDKGQVEEGKKDLNKAISMFQAALKVQPTMEQAWFKTAAVYEKLGDYDKALDAYRKCLKANPGFTDALYNMGMMLTNRATNEGNLARAAEQNGDAAGARAHLLKAKQYSAESEKLFSGAAKAGGSGAPALNNLGNVMFQQRNLPRAIELYSQALKTDPSYINAKLNLILAYIESRNYQAALPYVESLMRQILPGQQPDMELKAAFMAGTVYGGLNKRDQSMAVLSQAYNRYAGNPQVTPGTEFSATTLRYSALLADANRCNESIAILTSLSKSPRIPQHDMEMRYRIGFCNAKLNNLPEAKKWLQDTASKYPNTPYGNQAKLNLQQIGKMTARPVMPQGAAPRAVQQSIMVRPASGTQ